MQASLRHCRKGCAAICGVVLLCSPKFAFADAVPEPFAPGTRSDVAPGSIHDGDVTVITGIDQPAAIAVSGGWYSINGRTFTSSAGTVVDGDHVVVRAIASSAFASSATAMLTVGGVSAGFTLMTEAAPTGLPSPSLFKLDRYYAPEIGGYVPAKSYYLLPGHAARSASFTVAGLTQPAPIRVVNGSYSINGATPTSSPGTVDNGATIHVTGKAPALPNAAHATTLYIGRRAASMVQLATADVVDDTPTSLAGTQAFVIRDWAPVPQYAFVYKPANWTSSDRRSALLFFFGGAWTSGDPSKAVSWAKWAASKGMVGIAVDYRTNQRFGTSPLASVDDGRAALRWVQRQATALGIDSAKIAVGGNSAGGHVALWTAVPGSPDGSKNSTKPTARPAAIVLISAVSDTSLAGGFTPWRFGIYTESLSVHANLPRVFPPTIAFHGDADTTVPVTQSRGLCDLLQAGGNVCQFVNVPGGGHDYRTQPGLPGDWKNTTNTMVEQFLRDQHLLP